MNTEGHYYRIVYFNKDHSFKECKVIYDTEDYIDFLIYLHGTCIHVYRCDRACNEYLGRRIW